MQDAFGVERYDISKGIKPVNIGPTVRHGMRNRDYELVARAMAAKEGRVGNIESGKRWRNLGLLEARNKARKGKPTL